MPTTVRHLDDVETKSQAEVEKELVEKHEQETQGSALADTEVVKVEASQVEPEIDEVKVLSFIEKRYNKQINSIDELISARQEAEPLPEDVSAFLKYKKETGRGIDDFMKLNRDYDSMDSSLLLREYFRATQEGLDEDDYDALVSEYDYDEEFDDESVVKKAKIERKKVINDAKKYFTSQKEQYKIPLESSRVEIPEAEKQEYESYREYIKQAKTIEEKARRKAEWFDQKTSEVFNSNFKGFDFELNGKKITFTPGDAAELKSIQSNPENYVKKFLDSNGMLNDAVGYHKSLAIAMNPEKFAKFFYEQGQADAVDNLDKKMKNVNMSAQRTPEITKANGGFQVKAVNPDHGSGLKIRSAKKL